MKTALLGLGWLLVTVSCFYALIRFMSDIARLIIVWDVSAAEERGQLIALCVFYAAVFSMGMYVRRALLKALKLKFKVAQ